MIEWVVALLILLLIFFIFVLCAVLLFILYSLLFSSVHGSVYVPSPPEIVEKSLELGRLGPGDVFCDLGSGDGRTVRLAVLRWNVAKAIGYEISPFPRLLCWLYGLRLPKNLRRRISVIRAPLEDADLSDVDVVFLYVLPTLVTKVEKKLYAWKEIGENRRIVSVVFPIPSLIPQKTISVYHPTFHKNVEIFLYEAP